ncbi:lytic transglycosylase domain-containing protein [Paramuribaculum intestinale]|uniref:lytic transglycosylase domain-containing protein n=1 Tax=Paramuribaculum intestinale TaxID=2094151 RepID=UPI000D1F7566|nr:lytic transglycosylase domain-containing protein [Paramuribaculum intestinale]PWB12494.1 lytic transglycosylase [Paramuribaculum intestinale]WLT42003.1 lytic transglycosylase domain-containing protein [Paramuribaculum intestinale]
MNRLRNILTAMAVVAAMAAAAQFPNVVNPEIPAKVTFAGNTVSLDRDDMYERLDRELTAMAYTHGNTLLTIKRANRYFPVMAPILKRNGVPLDMLYLACIESTLNPRALSPAGAAGFWQLMPATAKEFGLEVNNFVDERYNLKKATEAACRYLKRAYSRYGNWESVAASYNGGMARISRELQAQGQNTAYNLYLTDETSRYMFRLLAMKLIMTRPADYGFSLKANQLYRAAECTPVKVSGPVDDWQQWAIDHGTTYMALRDHNPWIRAKSLPNKTGKTYTVMVPKPGAQMRSRQKPTVYDRNWIKD